MDDVSVTLLLAVQRALLGAVPATLRAVTCDREGTEIKLQFLFDGEIGEDDRDSAQVVGTEVIADFPSAWTISEEIRRLDYPADVRPYALAHWAYLRREPNAAREKF
jgi:hypothetical protein